MELEPENTALTHRSREAFRKFELLVKSQLLERPIDFDELVPIDFAEKLCSISNFKHTK